MHTNVKIDKMAFLVYFVVISFVKVVSFLAFEALPMKLRGCNDFDSCLELHLQSESFQTLLHWRCDIDQILDKMCSETISDVDQAKTPRLKRRVEFTHLPKTGGSSVRDFLKKKFGFQATHRTRCIGNNTVCTYKKKMGHEHYLNIALQESKDDIFATMLRDPITRALSFYGYVNQLESLHSEALSNKLWLATYKEDPIVWSRSDFVQRTLATDPLGFFLADVTNISDSITRFNYTALQLLPSPIWKYATPTATLSEFLQHTASMPDQYQCKQHLEVAYILLNQYAVVGTLEKRNEFLTNMFRRAKLDTSLMDSAADLHSNPTSYILTAAQKSEMSKNLELALFCPTVLWKLSGMISTRDSSCEM